LENEKNNAENSGGDTVKLFRWSYIVLPLVLFLLSLALIAGFYGMLPENVAYVFSGDGSPEKSVGRGQLVLWSAALQLCLTLAAVLVTRTIAGVYNRFVQPDSTGMNPGKLIGLMGNMLVLPQVIIFFAMIDIFSYNSYGTHFLPLWLNALIVLLAGGLILGIVFIRFLLQIRSVNKEKTSD
jgi:uncharacterized membrane protein